MNGNPPRPFLKWVGGKARFLPHFDTLLPSSFGRYFEPFLGGGALFFHLYKRGMIRHGATLSDLNEELITCWLAVQDDPRAVIKTLRVFQARHAKNPELTYTTIRALDWRTLSAVQIAARMIYLNKAGFNGLYRVNARGQFNVPRGDGGPDSIVDEANLIACAEALRGVTLTVADFTEAVKAVQKGDLVYFDPPYVPASATASFTAYTPGGFSELQHKSLSAVFAMLATERRAFVMLSNSDVPWTRERYTKRMLACTVDVHAVTAKRTVSADPSTRGGVSELLIRNWRGPKPIRPRKAQPGKRRPS